MRTRGGAQLDMITRTLMLVEQRLVLTEEKMAGLSRRQDEIVEALAARKAGNGAGEAKPSRPSADGGADDDQ